MSDELLREATELLDLAMAYVRTFGSSGSAPVVVDRDALDHASDELLTRYEAWRVAAASRTTPREDER